MWDGIKGFLLVLIAPVIFAFLVEWTVELLKYITRGMTVVDGILAITTFIAIYIVFKNR